MGGSNTVPWTDVAEVQLVRWSPQGLRTPQLRLVDVSGHVLLQLDLGDERQRSLVPVIRGRLGFVSWRSERRTSWV